jgi:hypothetical protein
MWRWWCVLGRWARGRRVSCQAVWGEPRGSVPAQRLRRPGMSSCSEGACCRRGARLSSLMNSRCSRRSKRCMDRRLVAYAGASSLPQQIVVMVCCGIGSRCISAACGCRMGSVRSGSNCNGMVVSALLPDCGWCRLSSVAQTSALWGLLDYVKSARGLKPRRRTRAAPHALLPIKPPRKAPPCTTGRSRAPQQALDTVLPHASLAGAARGATSWSTAPCAAASARAGTAAHSSRPCRTPSTSSAAPRARQPARRTWRRR